MYYVIMFFVNIYADVCAYMYCGECIVIDTFFDTYVQKVGI